MKKKKNKKIPVLLLDDLPNLGQRGEVILVKPGYYRYLISQNKVLLATKEKLEKELKPLVLEEKIKSKQEEVRKLKEKIENLTLEFKVNKFSKVTKEKIVQALKDKGFSLSKGQVDLKEKITQPGDYLLSINLGFNIFANLKIKVVSS